MFVHDYTKYIEELEESLNEIEATQKAYIRIYMTTYDIDAEWNALFAAKINIISLLYAFNQYMNQPWHKRLRPIDFNM